MKWLRRRARREERLRSTLELKISGQTIIGPVSLADLATMIWWGGYRTGDDLLGDHFGPIFALDPAVQLIVGVRARPYHARHRRPR